MFYAGHKQKFSVENVEERVLNSSASNNQWARHLKMCWIIIVEICVCCSEVYLKCFTADESMFAEFRMVSVLACILNIPMDCVFNFFSCYDTGWLNSIFVTLHVSSFWAHVCMLTFIRVCVVRREKSNWYRDFIRTGLWLCALSHC